MASLFQNNSHPMGNLPFYSKRLALSGLFVASVFVVLFALNLDANSNSTEEKTWSSRIKRRLATYSQVGTIPPDPDTLSVGPDVKEGLSEKYGRWHFWDGEEENRPDDSDLCKGFRNCDFEGDELKEDLWQSDAVFVNHLLNDADSLIFRAMEAIFEEYGHPKPDTAEGLAERMKMFHWDKIDLSTAEGPPEKHGRAGNRGNGGWTTRRSVEGLARRLLHAIMTRDEFTVVLAGHSSAAGHGNHFRQSYIMQFHRIMAPVLARLGVKLVTHNMSQGGLGTIQNAMAAGDLYGKEIDLLLWDSSMTEKSGTPQADFFFRQGLLGGNKVPVVWSAGGNFDILKKLHEEADVDVGEYGVGMDGIALTESDKQAKTLPWAIQYLKCDPLHNDVCKNHNDYCAKCWIDRKDGVKPDVEPQEFGGQVGWHPGWRYHQLQGRVIAFAVLEALQLAIQQFSEGTMGGPPLADDFWHVSAYYDNIRKKLQKIDGACEELKDVLPVRMCKTAMKGRSQYTPRANFDQTGINTIVKPAPDGYVPKNEKVALYEGPDEHNDCYDIPLGEVDVLAVVSGRRRRLENFPWNSALSTAAAGTSSQKESVATMPPTVFIDKDHRELDSIVPGKGWQIIGEPQGYCDGGFYSVCGRSADNPCILSGHHDSRGALLGTALSGWLVMTLQGVKEGIIVLKVHSWNSPSENSRVTDWKTVNNERRAEEMKEEYEGNYDKDPASRGLKSKDPAEDYPDNFVFEFAINGKITRWTKEQFIKNKRFVERVVETFTLLDDPSFTNEETDVEVAIRILECGNECALGVTHIYWA